MKFFNWSAIRLLLMFVLIIFLYSFTGKRNELRKLKKAEVVFDNSTNLFVSNETVNKLLIENNSEVKSIAKVELNLSQVEKSIVNQEMIQKAEVFVSVDGVLKAIVKQKTPIVRVFENGNSYYLDYEGNKMPLSNLSTARVPLVSGEITNSNIKKMAAFFKLIYDDDFLKKNIIGIQILPNDVLLLKNRNFDYNIDFGTIINAEKKFNNYKAFFQKAVLDSSLYKYRRINLKFTQQVVCIK